MITHKIPDLSGFFTQAGAGLRPVSCFAKAKIICPWSARHGLQNRASGGNYNTTFGPGFSVGENPAYYPGYENRIVKGQQGISNQIAGFSGWDPNSGSPRFGNGDIPSKVNFDSDNIVDELLEWYEYRKISKDPISLVDMFTKKTFSNYGGWYVDGKRKAIYQGQTVEIRVKNILDLERNNQSLYINSVNYADDYFNANKTIDFFLGGPQCGNCRWPTNYVNIRFYSRGTAMDAYFQVYGYYPK